MRLVAALSNFELIQGEIPHGREKLAVSTTSRQRRAAATEALHADLARRYKAGETVKALAAEFGMHRQTVRAVVAGVRVPVRTRQRLTADQVDEIQRLYRSGLTTTEIGEFFEVYASTIQRALKRRGVALRPAAPRPGVKH